MKGRITPILTANYKQESFDIIWKDALTNPIKTVVTAHYLIASVTYNPKVSIILKPRRILVIVFVKNNTLLILLKGNGASHIWIIGMTNMG